MPDIPCFSLLNTIRSQPYLTHTFFKHFPEYKSPALTYFSILDKLNPQTYIFLAFWTISNRSRTLAVLYFSLFQQYKTRDLSYFSILNRLKPQTYLILAFWAISDPSYTLAIPFFSIFNNVRPQRCLVLAFKINWNSRHTIFFLFEQFKTPTVP